MKKISLCILIFITCTILSSCQNKKNENIEIINKDEAKITNVSKNYEIEIKSDKKIDLKITDSKKNKVKVESDFKEGIITIKLGENNFDENEIYCINLEGLENTKFVDEKIEDARILYVTKKEDIGKETEYELINNNLKDEYIKDNELVNMSNVQVKLENDFLEKNYIIEELLDLKVNGENTTLTKEKELNLAKGKYEIEFEFIHKDKKFKVTKETIVKDVLDTITEDELIALAKKKLYEMSGRRLVITTGNLFQTNNDKVKNINGDSYYLINEPELVSLQELKKKALENFSEKYDNEDLFESYKEVDGNVYVKKIIFGLAPSDNEYSEFQIKERNGNEVVFSAYHKRANKYATFSLLYEDGDWKYGFWEF